MADPLLSKASDFALPGHESRAWILAEIATGMLRQNFNRSHIVRMDYVSFRSFDDRITALGTANLRSCSVVLVASKTAAIMAHIASRHVSCIRTMMDEFNRLYIEQRMRHFTPDKQTRLIKGIWLSEDGSVESEDQLHMINEYLFKIGLGNPPTDQYYFRNRPAELSPFFPGKGTVFVDAANGQLKIYVEDDLKYCS